ncbi:hypothetical protein DXG01_014298 [Tephrocybe rancida]|nr:hypothetical protein DXG01_014298 [Tephrocybe rancida]
MAQYLRRDSNPSTDWWGRRRWGVGKGGSAVDGRKKGKEPVYALHSNYRRPSPIFVPIDSSRISTPSPSLQLSGVEKGGSAVDGRKEVAAESIRTYLIPRFANFDARSLLEAIVGAYRSAIPSFLELRALRRTVHVPLLKPIAAILRPRPSFLETTQQSPDPIPPSSKPKSARFKTRSERQSAPDSTHHCPPQLPQTSAPAPSSESHLRAPQTIPPGKGAVAPRGFLVQRDVPRIE